MAKKYYIKVTDEHGNVIFNSHSDNARALIKRYNKAAYSSDGNMLCRYYFGRKETNISDSIYYRAIILNQTV